ncbi:hypothetical protein BKA59DRAFT_479818 [Fusarium tricinctum]|jgi:pectate lyase|uniref:Uncharacterized protein n=1 Tax=Fusarium tricinctum TaxID=61284 RepID=A0A8K0RXY8_9HYPO|nr:hypothetical protein BKA59DRAFT_479818 [Fusarium tricinctum]
MNDMGGIDEAVAFEPPMLRNIVDGLELIFCASGISPDSTASERRTGPTSFFGTAHVYSGSDQDLRDSDLTSGLTYGVNSQMGVQVLVEEIAVVDVHRPNVTNLDSEEQGAGRFWKNNNRFENSEAEITQEKDFAPSWDYVTVPGDCICELVNAKAKAGTGAVSA